MRSRWSLNGNEWHSLVTLAEWQNAPPIKHSLWSALPLNVIKGVSPNAIKCHLSLAQRTHQNDFYAWTPKSRSASFNVVFLSVDSLRLPIIKAHATLNSPAGNFFGYVPGITTERAGT